MMISRFTAVTAILVSLAMSSLGCSASSPDESANQGPDTDGGSTDGGHTDGGKTDSGKPNSDTDSGSTCKAPTDCPAATSACVEATCTAGVCGEKPKAAGAAVDKQVAGDCRKSQCDGAGKVVDVNDDTDVPVDSNDCTDDVCKNGVPSNPNKAASVACGAGLALKCDGAGKCLGCLAPTDCAGSDTECLARTCTAGTCGTKATASGVAVAAQTAGDCKKVVCDGAGSTKAVNDDGDLPTGINVCADNVCTAGVPSHPNKANGSSCGPTTSCLNGTCTGCVTASSCPGSDADECKTRTCAVGQCGFSFAPGGKVVAAQVSGNCKRAQCDGAGAVVNVTDNANLPADDGLECTSEACVAGVPSHPNKPARTPCNQNGGVLCDGAGVCKAASCSDGVRNGAETDVDCGGGTCPACTNGKLCGVATDCVSQECTGGVCTVPVGPCNNGIQDGAETDVDCGGGTCAACANGGLCLVPTDCESQSCVGGACVAPVVSCNDGIKNGAETGVDCGGPTCSACPAVTSTTPADAATGVGVASTIAILFNTAMSPATLTAQAAAGACSGSLQVSSDNFATCIGIVSPLALTAADTTVTLTPAASLSLNSTYKIKVTTAAMDARTNAVAAYTSATGFATSSDQTCNDGKVVISQVYGGGGNQNATYKNDFIELHNRGTTSVSLVGWSVQYAATAGAFTSSTALDGTIAAGAYLLIKGNSGGNNGIALPVADVTGSLDLSATSGKVALVKSTILIGAVCTGATVVDVVGYGTANCFNGAKAAPAGSATTAVIRGGSGCKDTKENGNDFTAAAPAPRNKATAALTCACP